MTIGNLGDFTSGIAKVPAGHVFLDGPDGVFTADRGGSRKGPILRHLPDPRYYFNVHTRSCAA